MTITEFRECVEYNIDHNIKHAILGLGAPGVGKSQIVRQIGKKYGFKVIDVRLAQMSEVEIGSRTRSATGRTLFFFWMRSPPAPSGSRLRPIS